jgi:nucleoside 2-deoxyribosyltransferase
MRLKVYCAGPLFTPYERDFVSRCGQALRERGIEAFVPHDSPKLEIPNDGRSLAKRVFDSDFTAIADAQAMLAVINGPEVDDGTACEIGVFYALMENDESKKGVVALHQDWRTQEPPGEGKGLNAFVEGCLLASGRTVHSLGEAVSLLAAWQGEVAEGIEGKP